jgi:hypothetical protein
VDAVPVAEVRRFESELVAFMRANHPELLAGIRSSGDLPPEAELDKALEAFVSGFDASSGDIPSGNASSGETAKPVAVGAPAADAGGEDSGS